jgi:FixJ family two-component response regulator
MGDGLTCPFISLPEDAMERLDRLPPRMREVVVRLCLGQPMKTIAADMGIALDTVVNHQKLAAKRFGLEHQDRSGIVAWVLLGVRQ